MAVPGFFTMVNQGHAEKNLLDPKSIFPIMHNTKIKVLKKLTGRLSPEM